MVSKLFLMNKYLARSDLTYPKSVSVLEKCFGARKEFLVELEKCFGARKEFLVEVMFYRELNLR